MKEQPCFGVAELIKIAVQCSKTIDVEFAKSLQKKQKYVSNDLKPP